MGSQWFELFYRTERFHLRLSSIEVRRWGQKRLRSQGHIEVVFHGALSTVLDDQTAKASAFKSRANRCVRVSPVAFISARHVLAPRARTSEPRRKTSRAMVMDLIGRKNRENLMDGWLVLLVDGIDARGERATP